MAARSARETLRQATAWLVEETSARPCVKLMRCLFARTASLRDCGGVDVLAVDVVPLGSRTCLRLLYAHGRHARG
jgi:hypothetical protein